ncbi:serine hydrolase domain-containing protein [uncultured Roseobacter sp.]|uniref:serine hydrolase n=1 Tax=uncultured Roseobacter sp. TaxID=114847 RepID=UPI00260BAA2F|nr:serine hydrolase domain-containing protein [uncultured Roseobacter sp.]
MFFSQNHSTATTRTLIRSRGLIAGLAILAFAGPVSAGPGFAPAALASEIDGPLQDLLEDGGIVGMTVAVTQGGRLIYSKGFGKARRTEVAGGRNVVMQPDHRTRIGSVSKAVVSGPALYQAMQARGMDPANTKVYGQNGILGTRYNTVQRVSTDRHNPIISIAIASDDRVYAWYRNGTVSIGTSGNLTAHQQPRSFRVAEGKELRDLHAVAISPDDHVYAWYKDGTRSIGTSRDLDARQAIPLDDDGKPTQKASLPVGTDGDRKSMHDVVGIAIAKSNSHVYVWYDDGTLSSGTSLDFDRYFASRTYASPNINQADYRYRIRGMGIAANDRVYAWSSGKLAFSGHSRNLTAYRAPYAYRHAHDVHQRNTFLDITVQHLFDHRSGFFGGGDVPATRRMYPHHGEPEYDLIHKHFLATRPLQWPAGERYSYSNHGMGLTTLLIEAVTGKTYREYTVNSYLRPMGLKGKVRAQKARPDTSDAWPYKRTSSGHEALEFKASTTGLAAGGWTASAQGVLGITTRLADTIGYDGMDIAAFRSTSRGKLSHNGSTGGGYATVAVFRDGYTAVSGEDLSDIHVAITTNTSGLSDSTEAAIRSMASTIAKAAANADVPVTTDYWNQAW